MLDPTEMLALGCC